MTLEERQRYAEWLAQARPLLDQKKWGEAMKDVPTLHLEPARPRPLAVPLHDATVALVSSAGISGPHQPPMDGPNPEGDYTIRVLDVDTPASELHIWQTHFDTAAALDDINVVYPIDRLKELAADGTIGRVAPQAVSFMGYFSNVYRIRDEVVPAVVDVIKRTSADAVVLVPV
ncbi:MAG: glycine/betaine/sarcosine/D-proline family reductase selenoprotein B [Chloroflexi bacterium]|nr:glycine/betaine/sarcosine/D-proline family reductase selenoprotein B [Chloroflexota bacterium]